MAALSDGDAHKWQLRGRPLGAGPYLPYTATHRMDNRFTRWRQRKRSLLLRIELRLCDLREDLASQHHTHNVCNRWLMRTHTHTHPHTNMASF